MPDQINVLIDAIEEKISFLRNRLSIERANNEKLHGENEAMKNEILFKEKEIDAHQSRISDFEKGISATQGQSVLVAEEKIIPEQQIDELVKEIEYCIAQLKK
jgi:chromosome segregation ATPase